MGIAVHARVRLAAVCRISPRRSWPHALDAVDNAARLRAAAAFTQPLLSRVEPPHAGDLPPAKSFVRVSPDAVMLSAARKKTTSGYEVRVVETEGQSAAANVEFGLPIGGAVETNLLGDKTGEDRPRKGQTCVQNRSLEDPHVRDHLSLVQLDKPQPAEDD